MKKGLLIFIALSVLVTSCTSKYLLPTEQVLQDPDKYKIVAITTVDGEVIEFPKGASLKDNWIIGVDYKSILRSIPLSEVKIVNCLKLDPVKSSLLALGCIGGCIALLIGFYKALEALSIGLSPSF